MTQPTVMDPAAFQARPRRRTGLGPLIATLATGLAVVAFVLGFGVWWRYAHPEVEIAWMANGVGSIKNLTSEPLEDVTVVCEHRIPVGARGFVTGIETETLTAIWDRPSSSPTEVRAELEALNRAPNQPSGYAGLSRPISRSETLPPGEWRHFILQGMPPDFPPALLVRDGNGRVLTPHQTPPPGG